MFILVIESDLISPKPHVAICVQCKGIDTSLRSYLLYGHVFWEFYFSVFWAIKPNAWSTKLLSPLRTSAQQLNVISVSGSNKLTATEDSLFTLAVYDLNIGKRTQFVGPTLDSSTR